MSHCAGCDFRHGDSEPCVLSREKALTRIEELECEIEKLKKALKLAMYYVEGDSAYEGLVVKIKNILDEE